MDGNKALVAIQVNNVLLEVMFHQNIASQGEH